MSLARLSGLGMHELAVRGRQEASRWLERLAGVSSETDREAAGRVSREQFAEAAAQRFFPGARQRAALSQLAEAMPDAVERVRLAAEGICEGRMDLLGYRGLPLNEPIQWGLDLVSGRRAPDVHWSGIDPLDPIQVGDSKVVWEIGRQQWLVTLAQAHLLTGEARFASVLCRHVRSFNHDNPPGAGIQWASSLEAALRVISWCWVLVLLRRSEALPTSLFGDMVAGISAHARHVERYLSHYFSPNTHLTGEALGLFYAGVVFPELPGAARWRQQGAEILVEQSRRQILPDGVYFEQSTCYQRYSLEIYLHFLILAAQNGLAVPREVGQRVQRMLDFLLAVRRPDGSMPSIGDADGGWLLPLQPREPDDLRGVFGVAAALFARPDYAWAAGGLAPEAFWLLGPAGLGSFEAVTPRPPVAPASRLFPNGGYAVMASGFEPESHHLIFDVGPLGCPLTAGHGHADLLSVQCSAFGQAFLVDPGTFVYTGQPAWRDHFRSSFAHSVLTVDGAGQAEPRGPFAWQDQPRARLRRWLSTPAYDLADGELDSYGGLEPRVLHRRRVVFVKPFCWVLADEVHGRGRRRVELRFQFAPLELERLGADGVRGFGRNGKGLLVRVFAGQPLGLDLHAGETLPPLGWVSPNYGCKVPAPTAVFSVCAPLPLRLVTLLQPVAAGVAPPEVVSLIGDEAGPAGLVVDGMAVSFSAADVAVSLAD